MSFRHGSHSTSARPQAFLRTFRPKSVRAKIVALLMVPVISLMALWAAATVSTVQSAWTLRQLKELNVNLVGPVSDLVHSLQSERAAVARYLTVPEGVEQQRARTEEAMRTLQNGVMATSVDIAGLAPDVNERIGTVERAITDLHTDRVPNIAGQMDWSAYNAYTAAIEDAFAVDGALTNVQAAPDASAARVVLQLARIGEMIARQDAVATSAQATGRMTPDHYQAFVSALGGQQILADSLLPDLALAEQTAYQRLVGSDPYRSLSSMQNAVLGDGAGAKALPTDQWRDAVEAVEQNLETIQASAGAAAAAQADSSRESALTQGAMTVILGLLAVLLALVISVQIGRGLVVELVELRNSALELARRRLPEAMRRLRAGEKIDVDADVPVVQPGDGEIGQVGEALNAVQRSALQAAAERAELLTGVSGVFVNLARRSQSLVHRQLTMLDAMERRTEDVAELEDLFRLDHLATRMRRHAESLIIMSGAAPGRAWSRPVPLMAVIRSAVAEVEDYARVEVPRMAEVSVPGAVVADLTHLVAELVENATSFSPPHTTVLVHGEPVGAGFAVEIEDRGLGMRPERMAEVNRRIADAHQLDLFDSDRLGLFVVSRLANRQNISVSLRRSPYGGTTAVVLLPTSILTPAEPEAVAAIWRDQPRRPVSPRPAPAKPRPAITAPAVAQEVPVSPANTEERAGSSTGGLPRRTRQASLAPGLRMTAARNRGHGTDEAEAAQNSPEQARATMSAFQDGFIRGRNGQSGVSTDT